eukprot:TRINITY_DN583_c0_g1_i1.p1 TRINITY_DN583_c0_g1~~TRINITY_DN583_c0_g1_i1.p1  ORF type:complete len:447 (-),score=132.96 TRINITY_DN583_c0_g1_i1:439-1779(-)
MPKPTVGKKVKQAGKRAREEEHHQQQEEEAAPVEETTTTTTTTATGVAPAAKKAKKTKKAEKKKPAAAAAAEEDAEPEEAAAEEEHATAADPAAAAKAPAAAGGSSGAVKRFQEYSPILMVNVPATATEEEIKAAFVAELGEEPKRLRRSEYNQTWTAFLATPELREQALDKSPILIAGAEVTLRQGIARGSLSNVYVYKIPAGWKEADVAKALNAGLDTPNAVRELRFLRQDPRRGGLAVVQMRSEELANRALEKHRFGADLHVYAFAPEGHPRTVSAWRIPDGVTVTECIDKMELVAGKGTVVDSQITHHNKGFFVLATEEAYQKALEAKELVWDGHVARLHAVVPPIEQRRLFFTHASGAMEVLKHLEPLGERAVLGFDLSFNKERLGQGSVVFPNAEVAEKALRLGPIVDGEREVRFSRDHSKPTRFSGQFAHQKRGPEERH